MSRRTRNVSPLVDALEEESLSTAKVSMQFLTNVSDCPPETRALYFDNAVRSRLEAIVDGGSSQSKLRVFEIAVDVAKKSRRHLDWFERC